MKYFDSLGHELHIGDNIRFRSSNMTIYGRIKGIVDNTRSVRQLDLFEEPVEVKQKKSKYIVTPIGFLGGPELKSKIKKEYKINVDNLSICLVSVKRF